MPQVSVSLTFLALSILCCLQVTVTNGSAVEKRYVTFEGTKSGMEIAGGTIYYLVAWDQWLNRKESLEKCACMGGELASISYGNDGGSDSELGALSETLKEKGLEEIDNISAKFWVNKKFAESGINLNSQDHVSDEGEYCRALEYTTWKGELMGKFMVYGRDCSYNRHYICEFNNIIPNANDLDGFLDGTYETCPSAADAPTAEGQKSGSAAKSLSTATITFAPVISILVICQM